MEFASEIRQEGECDTQLGACNATGKLYQQTKQFFSTEETDAWVTGPGEKKLFVEK